MSGPTEDTRYQELAKKWLDHTITPAEKEEFAAWYNSGQDSPVDIPSAFAENQDILKERILSKIKEEIKQRDKRQQKITPLKWLSIAASFLLLLVSGVIYIHHHHKLPKPAIAHQKRLLKNDAAPGGNKAILTLANGTQINLNDVKAGVLANQGQTVLRKTKEGQVAYQQSGGASLQNSQGLTYNTITIPKGGQFQLVLSDGSKVWLNSASSITFPAVFSNSERRVKITGEVYFEIAKNKSLPFRIESGKQTVEVLGTHFNINAYADESMIKTTLVEGSVKVYADNQTVTLTPDQQAAVFNGKAGKISIRTVDTDDVLAWTNGNFQFERAEIPMIMRQAARWYDVDVKYEGNIPSRKFTGSISRSVNLSELLKMLKYTGINFKIEGKTIIVGS